MAPSRDWCRFVALGDSFTEGLEDDQPNLRHRGWADRVADCLAQRDPRVQYANLAIRGRRLPQILAQQLPVALAMNPDLVCLEGGVNDTMRPLWDADTTRLMLEFGIQQVQRAGADPIMFAYGDPAPRSRTIGMISNRIRQLSEITADLCDKYGCYLVDLSRAPIFNDAQIWAPDRLHLNAAGHERVTRAVLDSLGVIRDPFWGAALADPQPVDRVAKLREDFGWTSQHLAPWLGRRVIRRSSGVGIEPKRPMLTPVRPVEFSTAA